MTSELSLLFYETFLAPLKLPSLFIIPYTFHYLFINI